LRELFAKVMRDNNEVDDGVFDWNTLHLEPEPEELTLVISTG
jgi:hypothetical protein